MCLMSYANNKGADQPAHPHSLISAFVVCCLDSIISLDSIAEISTLASYCGCAGQFVSGLVGNSLRHVLSCRGSFIIWAASWQNQQNGMCAQWILRSAQSYQSSLSAWRKLGSLATHWVHSTDQTGTLIWLGGCPGWSESSLGADVILLVLSQGSSFQKASLISMKHLGSQFKLSWYYNVTPFIILFCFLILCWFFSGPI